MVRLHQRASQIRSWTKARNARRLLTVLLILACALCFAASNVSAADPDWSNCVACHNGYESDLPRLSELRRSGPGTTLGTSCEVCHDLDFINRPRNDWSHPVRPVGAHLDCTQCHIAAPHGPGSPPPMPVGDYGRGCFECHAETEQALFAFSRHSLDARSSCISCHPPHQAMRAGLGLELLPRRIRGVWQGAYDYEQSNSACLACHHDPGLFSDRSSGFVSLNTVNYHALHVMDGQSLCIDCHDAHGSQRPKLIRSELLSGESLSFFERPDGATCTTRCHGVEHRSLQYTNRVN